MKHVPEWEWFTRIRQLGIRHFAAWALVLVPLLASVAIAAKTMFEIAIPLPANLVVLYAATLSFYVGSMLVDVFCPDFIREHQTFDRFLTFTVERTGQVQAFQRRTKDAKDALLSKLGEEITKRTGQAISTDQTTAILDGLIAEETRIAFVGNADALWKGKNAERVMIRVGTTGLFALAAVLALYLVLWDAPSRVFQAMTL